MTEIENDIGTALMKLRNAFAKHSIPCPDVLEYSDQGKAYRAIPELRHALSHHVWVMGKDAKPYGEASLAGFTLRMEAREVERPGTGVELDDGISGRIFQDKY